MTTLLRKGVDGKIPETPKPGSRYFRNVSNLIIGSNDDASNAAVRYLRSRGQRPRLLTTSLEGEARFAGMFMGSVLRYASTKREALELRRWRRDDCDGQGGWERREESGVRPGRRDENRWKPWSCDGRSRN